MKQLLPLLFIISISQQSICQLNNNISKEKKVALVIGVANYDFANTLKNPLNDANDIATKLKLLGFEVKKCLDPNLKLMSEEIDSFGTNIIGADVSMFYYSGHGAELNGENYLFPKDANPHVPNDLQFESFPLNKLLGKIQFANAKTNIILLDACRSNPFTKSWERGMDNYEGLANIDYSPNGTFIGFAASPGKTASDGVHNNGTYTEAILKFLQDKNASLDQIFNKVNKEVRTLSNGQQIPYKTSSLEDDFYFLRDSDDLLQENDLPKSAYLKAKLNRPKFPKPKEMKGHRLDNIKTYAQFSINKDTFKTDELIELYLNAIEQKLWDETTPIYVTLINKSSPSANGGIEEFQEEYQASSKNTKIIVAAQFEPGFYEIEVGFYFLSEFNGEYPPFHSKRFEIIIE